MVIYANVIESGSNIGSLPPNESISVQDEFGDVISVPVSTADNSVQLPCPLNFKTPTDFLKWYAQNKGKRRSSWTR